MNGNFLSYLNKYKLLIIILFFVIVVAVTFLFSQLSNQPKSQMSFPTPTIFQSQNLQPVSSFTVINTTPKDKEINIYPGEIIISFTTDKYLNSQDDFSLDISPSLPYYSKIQNAFPTKIIQAQVYGGLNTGTKYVVTVRNKNKETVYAWSFTTSSSPAQSNSGLDREREAQSLKTDYPLDAYLPYNTQDFKITYTDILTLKVVIKNPDVSKVKQEVNDWIKSHGIDPSTHTINYINSF